MAPSYQLLRSHEDLHDPSSTLPIPPSHTPGFAEWLRRICTDDHDRHRGPRTIPLGCERGQWSGYAMYGSNAINNRRYNILTFVPVALMHQFRDFFNLFYLLLAISQFVPVLQVGFLFTYLSPLVLVLSLSLAKEGLDEMKRWSRDRAANSESYIKLTKGGTLMPIPSSRIEVGDVLVLYPNQRIPADCILLATSEATGTTYLRTDQLDGETDWKLRYALQSTKAISYEDLSHMRANIRCEAPHTDIYRFSGVLDTTWGDAEAIHLDHTLWANCVVASGTLVGAVIHTGRDTRSAMNSSRPRTKRGLIEDELNAIALYCLMLLLALSFMLVSFQGFQGSWWIMLCRFLILMSAIIPISMRVNVDLGRLWYSRDIGRDPHMPGAATRATELPEELGRLQYLFSDKTGTLTKNQMSVQSIQVGPEWIYTKQHQPRLGTLISEAFSPPPTSSSAMVMMAEQRHLRLSPQEIHSVREMALAMVLCHNVSTLVEHGERTYQASSPDEITLVKYCASLGIILTSRDANSITFADPHGRSTTYTVLKLFPFTSERRCMGVVVREAASGPSAQIRYFMKGADTKMMEVVKAQDWLEESCQELAHAGLRTLVFATRTLTEQEYDAFSQQHAAASAMLGASRTELMEQAMKMLEVEMNLLGITGVEDELQDDVVPSLETLAMCGIRVWMLTGDKVETATTIGRSTRLISRGARVELLQSSHVAQVEERLAELRYTLCDGGPSLSMSYGGDEWALILDGPTLALCLEAHLAELFTTVASHATSVIVARCSPTQKAAVVEVMRRYAGHKVRMAAIGDGGNDVSMIQAAHVGIGVEGVEGKQASMAADFSITSFSHCVRLIMWHGRNSYRRTCVLSQFVMHRGVVYSVVQAIFSVLYAGITMSVFNGYLLMGYSTIFTMGPAFALVLDEDFSEADVHDFPPLYRELVKCRSMNLRTFLQWMWVSIFQAGVMMLVAMQVFRNEMFQIVSITYSALVLTELLVVMSRVHLRILWRQRRTRLALFLLAVGASVLCFVFSPVMLPDTFDEEFFYSWGCWWRIGLMCWCSLAPLYIFSVFGQRVLFNPSWVASYLR